MRLARARCFTCILDDISIQRVISREFGEQHRHVMHESCCTYHEKHHCVLEAVMTAVFVRSWCNTAILSGDNFCGMRVISREFGREHRHMMHEYASLIASNIMVYCHPKTLPNSRDITRTRHIIFPHPDKIAVFRRMKHKSKHS